MVEEIPEESKRISEGIPEAIPKGIAEIIPK